MTIQILKLLNIIVLQNIVTEFMKTKHSVGIGDLIANKTTKDTITKDCRKEKGSK